MKFLTKVLATEYPSKKSFVDHRGEGSGVATPWGKAQQIYYLAPGVMWVGTSGHGGLMVSPAVAMKKLTPQARANAMRYSGYYCYEEDVQYAIPMYEHPEWAENLDKIAGGKMGSKEKLKEQIEKWMPEYFSDKEINEAPQFKTLKVGDTLHLNNGSAYEVVEMAPRKAMVKSQQGVKYKLSPVKYESMTVKIERGGTTLWEKKKAA